MKKRYILTFLIPLILAAIIAYVLTPSVGKTFLSRLSKFESSTCYYEVKITYGPNAGPKERQKIKQYKQGNKYFAKYYIDRDLPLLVNVNGNEVKFGTAEITSKTTLDKLKLQHNLFAMDKLSVDDINRNSITRDRNSNEDRYYAKLNDGTRIVVTFDARGKLSRIEYNPFQYTTTLVGVDKKLGSVVVEIQNLDENMNLDSSYILQSGGLQVSYEELKKAIAEDYFDYDGAEEAFTELKLALGNEDVSDGDYEEEEDYSEDSEPVESTEDEVVEQQPIEPANVPGNIEEDFTGVDESGGPNINFEVLDNQPTEGFDREIPPEFEG